MKPLKLMKIISMVFISVFALVLNSPVFAASGTVNHTVTVSIPDVLSLTADTGAFTLTFPGFITGTVSDTKAPIYTIKANNLAQAAGATVVSVKVDSLVSGVDLKMDPGAYTKAGGNASLVESAAGFLTIDTVGVGAMKKVVDSGSGKVTRGTFPITYQAIVNQDLPPGSQLATLTVTATNV